MKDYTTYVSNGEKLANQIIALGYDSDRVEGALVDNYFFETDKGIKIGRSKPRKYIMLLGHFLNTWSSDNELIETDSDDEFAKMLKIIKKIMKKALRKIVKSVILITVKKIRKKGIRKHEKNKITPG